MSELLPKQAIGGEIVAPLSPAEARRQFRDALHSEDPWVRAEAAAESWLHDPDLAPGSRDQYRRVWVSWRTWCVQHEHSPFDAIRADVKAYVAHLQTTGNPASEKPKPLAPASVLRHMAALSAFYRSAIEDETTDRNPVPTRRMKLDQDSKQPKLESDQTRALFRVADEAEPRVAAFVAMLAVGALRVSEALSANIEDMIWEGEELRVRVRRKGGAIKNIYMPPQARDRIAVAVAGRRTGPIVAGPRGGRLARSDAWRLIRDLGERAGIKASIGPHTLRHAYVTLGFELQIPVAEMQRAAGHAKVDTTRRYDRRGDLAVGKDHPSWKIAQALGIDL